jgi:hypothetical protein
MKKTDYVGDILSAWSLTQAEIILHRAEDDKSITERQFDKILDAWFVRRDRGY